MYALNVISSVMFASLSVYSFVLIDSRQLLQMFIDVIDLRRKPLHSSTLPHTIHSPVPTLLFFLSFSKSSLTEQMPTTQLPFFF